METVRIQAVFLVCQVAIAAQTVLLLRVVGEAIGGALLLLDQVVGSEF